MKKPIMGRPPVSASEPAERYTIRLPESLRLACLAAGPKKIRAVLAKALLR